MVSDAIDEGLVDALEEEGISVSGLAVETTTTGDDELEGDDMASAALVSSVTGALFLGLCLICSLCMCRSVAKNREWCCYRSSGHKMSPTSAQSRWTTEDSALFEVEMHERSSRRTSAPRESEGYGRFAGGTDSGYLGSQLEEDRIIDNPIWGGDLTGGGV